MKKTIKKSAALALAAILSMSMLTGCGKPAGTDANEANSGGVKQTSDKIIMGTNAAFQPFEFVADKGKGIVGDFDGIDIAIAKKISEKLGKELVIEDMEFDGLVASVQTGKIDFAAAGMTATDERRQSVDFSDTYYVAEQVMVVAANNQTIKTAADLKTAKMVGVVAGYTGDLIVTDDLKIDSAKILRVTRGIDGVQEVKNGKLDAMVIDSATGIALAKENGLKVVEDKKTFAAEEYAIAVGKGNKELLKTINEVLADMKAKGEIDALAKKYNG